MIVLDASVLIAYLDGDDARHTAAEALLARSIDDDLGVTPLTLAEVLVGPARRHRLEPARAAVRALRIQELPFPVDTALRLAELHIGTGLRMPDCCVLLAAEDAGAAVATFDERLAKASVDRQLPLPPRQSRP